MPPSLHCVAAATHLATKQILEACGGPVDVMPHHVIRRAEFSPPWEVTDKLYRRVMRDPDSINYVTLLREPREHLISFYYFFYEHTTEVRTRP